MSSASVLGESWVVASAPSRKERQDKDFPKTPTQKTQPSLDGGRSHGSDQSIVASTASMSGPELIMPSIYETPISEASWVAPTVRAKQSGPSLRRRHDRTLRTDAAAVAATEIQSRKSLKRGSRSPATPKSQPRRNSRMAETSLRVLANIILLAAIFHLLVLPELVQQYQSLCTIGTISALYPSSCIPLFPQPFSQGQGQPSTQFGTVISSQTRLVSIFNATLEEMAPLNGSLKQTDSQLRDLERQLKHAHPGTRHELDLEFDSCWQAIRVAIWKFDSLKVNLQSAVDNLIAAGDVKPAIDSRASVAQDARLSTQMSRREQYLDELTTRMRSKADSLAADLATLDDHLESIEGIVARETRQSHSSPIYRLDSPSQGSSYTASRLRTFVDAVLPQRLKAPSFLRPPEREENNAHDPGISPEVSLLQISHEATTHHRPVTDMARNLSNRLHQSLQARKTVSLYLPRNHHTYEVTEMSNDIPIMI
ncbi:hypothetical protein P175DRAFT_0499394 [Aspergillus ochraceoroseus IBT 24754]|uniref:Uncharacterized protein n=2 Tax=Aspergillus ochraceoroseus TaxID=138278 RepID=A0A2T5M2V6_9EURO|nr:uncharacterized protein P175DRAFT_0499394 [Aspergillus ochraceoroseus IBT 24754]KKK15934.1 hypothetical protein AOCH_000662 [Aspergillus ochraceoroseus]PTU22858.1 hypothetical protein P175DRAFT_0499394 [Aspergillus ochraceoroseus IBT 24754]